ncbi:MAG TPA: NAD(P)/FAD-dependent oxidoreductase [Verrucomicrobiae bacterium]|jgi:digeranylgeranylglycerophospholipid reductase|nr:NAD(P)/FAD-dependent oxidoreductase [Verrucomicrobiae bacterium]
MTASAPHSDCVVVGASFAGLACATALARTGLSVVVLEKKNDPGEKLHTTGIIVKDAIDQITLLDGLPDNMVRRISGVRLYAPNLSYVDLAAPGYYFLATDTPEVMRWLAGQAQRAGARVEYGKSFEKAARIQIGFDLGDAGKTRFLVGADGPRSRVAEALALGRSEKFLFGIEYEYADAEVAEADKLHCFIDRRLAPGYIAWVVAGVGVVQVGLARRIRGDPSTINKAMTAFLDKIAPLFDFRMRRPASVRAGMIPCGGLVRPVAAKRALLVGDAAGMVSPVTAGGIHTALKHGLSAGHAIADYLAGKREDPSGWFVESYPRFRTKRVLRFMFDHFQSDLLFNLLLGTKPMRLAAGMVYFHHKGVFEPDRKALETDPEAAEDRPL